MFETEHVRALNQRVKSDRLPVDNCAKRLVFRDETRSNRELLPPLLHPIRRVVPRRFGSPRDSAQGCGFARLGADDMHALKNRASGCARSSDFRGMTPKEEGNSPKVRPA